MIRRLGRSSSLHICSLIAALALAAACSKQTQPSPPIPHPANGGQTLSGRVVRIADGDTLTVLDSNNLQHRIRLLGIDAPESHQAFGAQSKKNLSEMIFGKDVTIVYAKNDQYGRILGKIFFDGTDVNLEQIKAGMAWHYKEYERDQPPEDRAVYAQAEVEARAARRGLWRDSDPEEPSAYRRDEREQRNAR